MSDFRYRISFPAGFGLLVRRLAERDFGPSAILDGDDSNLLLRSEHSFRTPPYAQAASLVVDAFPCPGLEAAFQLFAGRLREEHARKALSRVFHDKAFMRTSRAETYAVRGFMGNAPAFPGAEARGALEAAISRLTGARPHSVRPNVELSVSLRDDGNAYFTASFQTDKASHVPEAGELPRCTARLLCELSEPRSDDVFLDPFMGSGSIPLERARMGPYKLIFASDRDEALVAKVKERLKKKEFERHKRTFFPKRLDATDLGRFEDGLFSSIVTDPPWGDWESLSEAELLALYVSFLAQTARVLSPEGRLVLLVGRNDALERAIPACGYPWVIEEEYAVLISGKKARALRLSRGKSTLR